MEPENFLPHSKAATICPYSESNQSRTCFPILFLKDRFQYSSPIHAQVFQVITFRQTSPPKSYTLLSCLAYVPHGRLILLYLINEIVFVDQYRSPGSSTCSLLQSPFTSSLLDQYFLPYNLFLYTLNLCFFLKKISTWRKISVIENWNSPRKEVFFESFSICRKVSGTVR